MSTASEKHPDAIRLGYRWNPKTGETTEPLTYPLESGVITIAPTKSGKGVGIEIPTLASYLGGMSVLSIDPTGQNAATCAEARRKMGHKVLCVNPTNAHTDLYPDLQSVGCNPLVAGIDPKGPRFYGEAITIADALNWGSEKGDPFFSDSGKNLVTAIVAYVRVRDGDTANISTVMRLLMEHEKIDKDGKPTQGLRFTAAHMATCGVSWIELLAGQFLGNPGSSTKTIDGIVSTAKAAARSLLDDEISNDLGKNGVDFAELTRQPVSVFVIPPQANLSFHAVWMRLIVTTALNVYYRQMGNVNVEMLLMLSEFPSFGNMRIIQDALAQTNKFGLRTWCILQNWGQLTSIYGHDGATGFISNTGCMIAFRSNDAFTSKMLSEHTGEHNVDDISYSQNQNGELNVSTHVRREKLWPPEKIQSLPRHHGLVWLDQSHPIPVFLQPYFEDRAFAHVSPDPFELRKKKHPAQVPHSKVFARTRKLVVSLFIALICVTLLPLLSGFKFLMVLHP